MLGVANKAARHLLLSSNSGYRAAPVATVVRAHPSIPATCRLISLSVCLFLVLGHHALLMSEVMVVLEGRGVVVSWMTCFVGWAFRDRHRPPTATLESATER